MGRVGGLQMKAAEDSRTPKPRGGSRVGKNAPASWSAAVLCRFTPILRDGRPRPHREMTRNSLEHFQDSLHSDSANKFYHAILHTTRTHASPHSVCNGIVLVLGIRPLRQFPALKSQISNPSLPFASFIFLPPSF